MQWLKHEGREFVVFYTRLACFYVLQLNEEIKGEFFDYLDRFPVSQCCGILISILTKPITRKIKDYFAKRWTTEDYHLILEEIAKHDFLYDEYAPRLLTAAFQKYIKENNNDELRKLISYAEKIEDTGDVFPWIDSLVPYGSPELIGFLMTKVNTEVINLIFQTALEFSEERLREIMTILNNQGISFLDQLNEYIDDVDWEDYDPESPYQNIRIFNIIVTKLLSLGNIDIKTLNVRKNSMFEAYIDRLENQI